MDGKKQAEERVRQNEMETEGEEGEGHEEYKSKPRQSFEATHVERVKWVGGVVRCSCVKARPQVAHGRTFEPQFPHGEMQKRGKAALYKSTRHPAVWCFSRVLPPRRRQAIPLARKVGAKHKTSSEARHHSNTPAFTEDRAKEAARATRSLVQPQHGSPVSLAWASKTQSSPGFRTPK